MSSQTSNQAKSDDWQSMTVSELSTGKSDIPAPPAADLEARHALAQHLASMCDPFDAQSANDWHPMTVSEPNTRKSDLLDLLKEFD